MKRRLLVISTITFLAAAVVASLFLFTRSEGEPYSKSYLALSQQQVSIKMDVESMLVSGRSYETDVIVTAKNMPSGAARNVYVESENLNVASARVINTSGSKSTVRITATNGGKTRIRVMSAGGGIVEYIDVNILVPAKEMDLKIDARFGVMKPVTEEPAKLTFDTNQFDFFATARDSAAYAGYNYTANYYDIVYSIKDKTLQGFRIEGQSLFVDYNAAPVRKLVIEAKLKDSPSKTLDFPVYVFEPFSDVTLNYYDEAVVGTNKWQADTTGRANLVLNEHAPAAPRNYINYLDYKLGVTNLYTQQDYGMGTNYGFFIANNYRRYVLADFKNMSDPAAAHFRLIANGITEVNKSDPYVEVVAFPMIRVDNATGEPTSSFVNSRLLRFDGDNQKHVQKVRRINIEVRNVFKDGNPLLVDGVSGRGLNLLYTADEGRDYQQRAFKLKFATEKEIIVSNTRTSATNANIYFELAGKGIPLPTELATKPITDFFVIRYQERDKGWNPKPASSEEPSQRNKWTPGVFYPGGVGGVNAGTGIRYDSDFSIMLRESERDAQGNVINPWGEQLLGLPANSVELKVCSVDQRNWPITAGKFDLGNISLNFFRTLTTTDGKLDLETKNANGETTNVLYPVIEGEVENGKYNFSVHADGYGGTEIIRDPKTNAEISRNILKANLTRRERQTGFEFKFDNAAHKDLFIISAPIIENDPNYPAGPDNPGILNYTIMINPARQDEVNPRLDYTLKLYHVSGVYIELRISPVTMILNIKGDSDRMDLENVGDGLVYAHSATEWIDENNMIIKGAVRINGDYTFTIGERSDIWVTLVLPAGIQDGISISGGRSFIPRREGTYTVLMTFHAFNDAALGSAFRENNLPTGNLKQFEVTLVVVNPLVGVKFLNKQGASYNYITLYTPDSVYSSAEEPWNPVTTAEVVVEFVYYDNTNAVKPSVPSDTAPLSVDVKPQETNAIRVEPFNDSTDEKLTVKGTDSIHTRNYTLRGLSETNKDLEGGYSVVQFIMEQKITCPDLATIGIPSPFDGGVMELRIKVERAQKVTGISLAGLENTNSVSNKPDILEVECVNATSNGRYSLNPVAKPKEEFDENGNLKTKPALDPRLGYGIEVFDKDGNTLITDYRWKENATKTLSYPAGKTTWPIEIRIGTPLNGRNANGSPITGSLSDYLSDKIKENGGSALLVSVDENGVIQTGNLATMSEEITISVIVFALDCIQNGVVVKDANEEKKQTRTFRNITVDIFDSTTTKKILNLEEFLGYFYNYNKTTDIYEGKDFTGAIQVYYRLAADINLLDSNKRPLKVTPIKNFNGTLSGTTYYSIGAFDTQGTALTGEQRQIRHLNILRPATIGNNYYYGMFANLIGKVEGVGFGDVIIGDIQSGNAITTPANNAVVNMGVVAGVVEEDALVGDVSINLISGKYNVNRTSTFNFGGVAGTNKGTVLERDRISVLGNMVINCSSSDADASNVNVGGLVGYNMGEIMNNTDGGAMEVFEGDGDIAITSELNLAIVGNITDDFNAETKDHNMGGLVGRNEGTVDNVSCNGILYNSFRGNTGGLVGLNQYKTVVAPEEPPVAIIMNCYTNSIINARGAIGGLVGLNKALLNDGYYDFFSNKKIKDKMDSLNIASGNILPKYYAGIVAMENAKNNSVDLRATATTPDPYGNWNTSYPTIIGGVAGVTWGKIDTCFALSAFIEFDGKNTVHSATSTIVDLEYKGDIYIDKAFNAIVGGMVGYQAGSNPDGIFQTFSQLIVSTSEEITYHTTKYQQQLLFGEMGHPDTKYYGKAPLYAPETPIGATANSVLIGGTIGYLNVYSAWDNLSKEVLFASSYFTMLIMSPNMPTWSDQAGDFVQPGPGEVGTYFLPAAATYGFFAPVPGNGDAANMGYRDKIPYSSILLSSRGNLEAYKSFPFFRSITKPQKINFLFREYDDIPADRYGYKIKGYNTIYRGEENNQGGANFVVPARENNLEANRSYMNSGEYLGFPIYGFDKSLFYGYDKNYMPSAALFYTQGTLRPNGGLDQANRYFLEDIFQENHVVTEQAGLGAVNIEHTYKVVSVIPNDASGRVAYELSGASGVANIGTAMRVDPKTRKRYQAHYIQVLGEGSFTLIARSTRSVKEVDTAVGHVRFDVVRGITTQSVTSTKGGFSRQTLTSNYNNVQDFAVRKSDKFTVNPFIDGRHTMDSYDALQDDKHKLSNDLLTWSIMETRGEKYESMALLPVDSGSFSGQNGRESEYKTFCNCPDGGEPEHDMTCHSGLEYIEYTFTPFIKVEREVYFDFYTDVTESFLDQNADKMIIYEGIFMYEEPEMKRLKYTYEAKPLEITVRAYFYGGVTNLRLEQSKVSIDSTASAVFAGTLETDESYDDDKVADLLDFHYKPEGNSALDYLLFKKGAAAKPAVIGYDSMNNEKYQWQDDSVRVDLGTGVLSELSFKLRFNQVTTGEKAREAKAKGFKIYDYEVDLNIKAGGYKYLVGAAGVPIGVTPPTAGNIGQLTIKEAAIQHYLQDSHGDPYPWRPYNYDPIKDKDKVYTVFDYFAEQGVYCSRTELKITTGVEILEQEVQTVNFQHFSKTSILESSATSTTIGVDTEQYQNFNIYADSKEGGLLRVEVGPTAASIVEFVGFEVESSVPGYTVNFRQLLYQPNKNTEKKNVYTTYDGSTSLWPVSRQTGDRQFEWDGNFYFETKLTKTDPKAPEVNDIKFNIYITMQVVNLDRVTGKRLGTKTISSKRAKNTYQDDRYIIAPLTLTVVERKGLDYDYYGSDEGVQAVATTHEFKTIILGEDTRIVSVPKLSITGAGRSENFIFNIDGGKYINTWMTPIGLEDEGYVPFSYIGNSGDHSDSNIKAAEYPKTADGSVEYLNTNWKLEIPNDLPMNYYEAFAGATLKVSLLVQTVEFNVVKEEPVDLYITMAWFKVEGFTVQGVYGNEIKLSNRSAQKLDLEILCDARTGGRGVATLPGVDEQLQPRIDREIDFLRQQLNGANGAADNDVQQNLTWTGITPTGENFRMNGGIPDDTYVKASNYTDLTEYYPSPNKDNSTKNVLTQPRNLNFIMTRTPRDGGYYKSIRSVTGVEGTSVLKIEMAYSIVPEDGKQFNNEPIKKGSVILGNQFGSKKYAAVTSYDVKTNIRSSEIEPIRVYKDANNPPKLGGAPGETQKGDANWVPITRIMENGGFEPGQYYIIMDDIDLPRGWVPFEFNAAMLDGNNKRITLRNDFNLDSDPDSKDSSRPTDIGIFSTIKADCIIKNLNIVLPSDTPFEINLREYTDSATLNIGALAGKNAGIVTNVSVLTDWHFKREGEHFVPNLDLSSPPTNKIKSRTPNDYIPAISYGRMAVLVDNPALTLNIGGLVGINEPTGIISNSRVIADVCVTNLHRNSDAEGMVPENVKMVVIAGFVGINQGTILSSYFANGSIINNCRNVGGKDNNANGFGSYTAGFVGINAMKALIRGCYMNGNTYKDFAGSMNNYWGEISSLYGNTAGFVYVNGQGGNSIIEDCYLSMLSRVGARRAGFVFDNMGSGVIRNCLTENFLGSYREGAADSNPSIPGWDEFYAIVPGMNGGTFQNNKCVPVGNPTELPGKWDLLSAGAKASGQTGWSNSVYNIACFAGFSISNSNRDNMWNMTSGLLDGKNKTQRPRLVAANNDTVSIREYNGYNKYTNRDTLMDLGGYEEGSAKNPIIISTGLQFNTAMYEYHTSAKSNFDRWNNSADKTNDNNKIDYSTNASDMLLQMRLVNNISLAQDELDDVLNTYQTIFGQPGSNILPANRAVLDGNGLEIRDISLNAAPGLDVARAKGGNILESIGLFSKIENAIIKNVTLSFSRHSATSEYSVGATTSVFTGGLAGQAINSKIIDVEITSKTASGTGWLAHILGGNVTGGLVGYARDTEFESVRGNITVLSNIGRGEQVRTPSKFTDGLNKYSNNTDNYNTYFSNIQGNKKDMSVAGGLVGFADGTTTFFNVSNSSGGNFSVSGEIVGGLVGVMTNNTLAENVSLTSSTRLTAKYYAGGVVGMNFGYINNGSSVRPDKFGASNHSANNIFALNTTLNVTPQASQRPDGSAASDYRVVGAVKDGKISYYGIIAGGVAGFNSGAINNVKVRPTINNVNLYAAGGVVGRNVGDGLRDDQWLLSSQNRHISFAPAPHPKRGEIKNSSVEGTENSTALRAGFFTGGLVADYANQVDTPKKFGIIDDDKEYSERVTYTTIATTPIGGNITNGGWAYFVESDLNKEGQNTDYVSGDVGYNYILTTAEEFGFKNQMIGQEAQGGMSAVPMRNLYAVQKTYYDIEYPLIDLRVRVIETRTYYCYRNSLGGIILADSSLLPSGVTLTYGNDPKASNYCAELGSVTFAAYILGYECDELHDGTYVFPTTSHDINGKPAGKPVTALYSSISSGVVNVAYGNTVTNIVGNDANTVINSLFLLANNGTTQLKNDTYMFGNQVGTAPNRGPNNFVNCWIGNMAIISQMETSTHTGGERGYNEIVTKDFVSLYDILHLGLRGIK